MRLITDGWSLVMGDRYADAPKLNVIL